MTRRKSIYTGPFASSFGWAVKGSHMVHTVCVCVCVCVWCDFLFQITLKHALVSSLGTTQVTFCAAKQLSRGFLVKNVLQDCECECIYTISKSVLVLLSLLLAACVWINVIPFGNVILSLSVPRRVREPFNYAGWGSTPLFWWCNVSLHLVRVTHAHMTVLGAPGFGWGVSGSPTLSQCAYQGSKRKKQRWWRESGVRWGVCPRGLGVYLFIERSRADIFPLSSLADMYFSRPVQPSHNTPPNPRLQTHHHSWPQTFPNHTHTVNSGGTAQI